MSERGLTALSSWAGAQGSAAQGARDPSGINRVSQLCPLSPRGGHSQVL